MAVRIGGDGHGCPGSGEIEGIGIEARLSGLVNGERPMTIPLSEK